MNFEKELEILINKYSKENDSNTLDFILAEYLWDCFLSFNRAVRKRDDLRIEKSPSVKVKDNYYQPTIVNGICLWREIGALCKGKGLAMCSYCPLKEPS